MDSARRQFRWMILVAILTATPSLTTFGQIKLVQGFETLPFPPTGWSVQYSGTLYWERASVGGYGASSSSAVFRFYEAPASVVQSLLTSTFTPTSVGDSLSFDYAYATYDTEVDSLVIETSTDGGSSFVRLVALAGGPNVGSGMVTAPPDFNSFVPTASQWGTKSYALSAGTNMVRFTAKSAFGNNLYLDNIRVSALLADDVGVTGILSPRYFINLPFPETPRATIKNFGSNSQTTAFTTEMRISGPAGFSYTSTVSDTLSSGLTRELSFPSLFNPTQPGTYSVVCITQLAADQERSNDTLRTTVTAGNYNYGTNGGVADQQYFFVNSLAGNGAPAQPQFRWRDTTGSRDLIVNGVAVVPLRGGDLDDGYFRISGLFPGESFRLFGTEYTDSIFISTNGIISFAAGYEDFIPTAIPSGATPNAALYPMWMDFDFSDPDVPVNRLSYKIDGDLLIVTFARAPRYNANTDPNDYLSFQVCLRYAATHSANSFASVQFDSANTGSSFLSQYQSYAFVHLIGAENATGTSAITYRFVSGGAPVTPGPAFGSSLALTLGPGYASSVTLAAKAFLQGAYSTSLHAMRTTINALIPFLQPYTASPWIFPGAEKLAAVPPAMADWILVDLRAATAAASRAARRSGLLLNNGTIVDLDAVSPLTFDLMSPGNYYVVLSHRNHLSVMTASAQTLSGTALFYDFTTGQGQAFGTLPMNQLETGVFGMISGDADASSSVSSADATAVFNSINVTSYSSKDVNLSGIVSAADANEVYGNLGRTTQVPTSAPMKAPALPSVRNASKKR